MSNPKRRESNESLLADLRKRVERLEGKRSPASAKKLDDLSDVEVPSPAPGNVLAFDGALWVASAPIPSDLGVTETLQTVTDDGIFDEAGGWTYQPDLIVPGNTYQLVVVDVLVSISDVGYEALGTDGVSTVTIQLPTPWKVTVQDTTGDPGGDALAHANGTGSCGATAALWVHNATDTDASHTLNITVEGSWFSAIENEFDATVTATARTVFSLTSI